MLIQYLFENQDEKIMIFLNTCASVDFYEKILKNLKVLTNVFFDIHGQMKQKKRNKVIEKFRESEKGN
jgi:superfamily II DNA/RNA helicase